MADRRPSESTALAALAARLDARGEDLPREIMAIYRGEIVDYAAASESFLERDVLEVTRRGVAHVIENLAADRSSPHPDQVAEFRRLLARRPHQGVGLPAIQHAFRLFGEAMHDSLTREADPSRPEELQAVIRGAAIIMRFTNEVIGVVTQTYLDELEDVRGDREIVSRALLDAVLTGHGDAPSTQRDARILGIELVPQQVVVVARAAGEGEGRPRTLRAAAKTLRTELLPRLAAGPPLVGIRDGEVVCLCAAPTPSDGRLVAQAAHDAATGLDPHGLSVGVGGRQLAAGDVPVGYAQAREAVEIALRTGVSGRAVVYDDVLLDHVLRENPSAGRLVGAAIEPLRDYDRRRRSDLVATLEAYIDAGFSVTRAARALHVHNNTVVYRLERIREISGRDPRNPHDVVLLALGLRLEPSRP